jgi:excisionase family DNA binding protein
MANLDSRSVRAHKDVKLYSVTQVAEILDCSDMHVYRLIAAGELRAADIGTPGSGRPKSRIRSDDLADYIDRNTRGRAS